MIKGNKTETVILLDEHERPAGEFENKEKTLIKFDKKYQITFIPVGEKEVQKVNVAKEFEGVAKKALDNIHYGALLQISYDNKNITEIEVISDLLSDYFEK